MERERSAALPLKDNKKQTFCKRPQTTSKPQFGKNTNDRVQNEMPFTYRRHLR